VPFWSAGKAQTASLRQRRMESCQLGCLDAASIGEQARAVDSIAHGLILCVLVGRASIWDATNPRLRAWRRCADSPRPAGVSSLRPTGPTVDGARQRLGSRMWGWGLEWAGLQWSWEEGWCAALRRPDHNHVRCKAGHAWQQQGGGGVAGRLGKATKAWGGPVAYGASGIIARCGRGEAAERRLRRSRATCDQAGRRVGAS